LSANLPHPGALRIQDRKLLTLSKREISAGERLWMAVRIRV